MLARCPMVVGYRGNTLPSGWRSGWVKAIMSRCWKSAVGELVKIITGRVSRKRAPKLAALLPLLANGKTSHAMHDTFRELHQQIRCNADEQAAQAVLELAQ
ncbi:hypothetical protein F4W66_24590 (plasmid) [Escherichia coli]|nr:hypothetical protein F4W66_24590 [Escherichia coli]